MRREAGRDEEWVLRLQRLLEVRIAPYAANQLGMLTVEKQPVADLEACGIQVRYAYLTRLAARCSPFIHSVLVRTAEPASVSRSIYASPNAGLSSSARRLPSSSSARVSRKIPPRKKMMRATMLRRLVPVT